jgi:hypothetical protein
MIFPIVVSFVGVDTQTDLDALRAIQDLRHLGDAPVIEWGVLYSPQRAGKQKRYPTLNFVEDFLMNEANANIRMSLHLCGAAVEEYLYDENSVARKLVNEGLCRTQLNFAMDKYDAEELANLIVKLVVSEGHNLIVQHNKSKKKFVETLISKFQNVTNTTGWVDFLYDGSGGFGRVIEKFDPPINGYFTGYAGGLKPENVEQIVRGIGKVANDNYYIDMESGVRTNDLLDLEKCKAIMQTLENMRAQEVMV